MAWAFAQDGEMLEARRWIASASERAVGQSRREWLIVAAAIETAYGEEAAASALVQELTHLDLNPAFGVMAPDGSL
jgi:hypothetical protein